MVSDLHMHVGDRAVRNLLMGVEHRRLDARMRRPRKADDHPLCEERPVVGPGEEVAPGAAHDAEPVWYSGEDVLQRPLARPPELVRVGVDHPVRVVFGGRESRHPGHPLGLTHLVARLAQQPQAPCALVALEDLRRPVGRCVVRRDHEVDTGVQVERDLRIDDVGLVADEQRHDEPHATGWVAARRSIPSSRSWFGHGGARSRGAENGALVKGRGGPPRAQYEPSSGAAGDSRRLLRRPAARAGATRRRYRIGRSAARSDVRVARGIAEPKTDPRIDVSPPVDPLEGRRRPASRPAVDLADDLLDGPAPLALRARPAARARARCRRRPPRSAPAR